MKQPLAVPHSGLGVACSEAQADGVPCPEAGCDCKDCERARACATAYRFVAEPLPGRAPTDDA